MKFVHYNATTHEVLDAIDTEETSIYALPEEHELTKINDEEYQFIAHTPSWTNGIEFTHTPPPDLFYKLLNGQWIKDENIEIEAIKRRKQELIVALKNKSQEFSNLILAEYPTAEQLSFERQLTEAQEYKANQTSNIPVLTAIAEARGLTIDNLVAKVLKKSKEFAQLSGKIAGKRQAIADLINQANDIKTLSEIEQNIKKWSLNDV